MRHATATPLPWTAPTRSDDDLAIAGWLARYSGLTADAYRTTMRIFLEWCVTQGVRPLELKRPHIELFLRHCETERGNQPQTIETKLGALRSFYTSAVEDEYLTANPAHYVKAPKWQRDESKLVALRRREAFRLLDAAKASTPCEEALITLLLVLGLRNHEARGIRIEDIAQRVDGLHVLSMVGKGRKEASIPLPVPVMRSLRRAIGDRTEGQVLEADWPRASGPLSKYQVSRAVERVAERAGLGHLGIHPHALRHAHVTVALDLGIPLHLVQASARHVDPRTTIGYQRQLDSLDKHAVHTMAAAFAS